MKNIWSDYADDLFRPFRAGLFFDRCSVGFTHGYSRCSPPANCDTRRPSAATGNLISKSSQRVRLLSPPHEPRSSGRESAPTERGGKFEPTHVGCYGSGVQSANDSGKSLPGGEGQGEGERDAKTRPARNSVRGMFVRGIKTKPKEFCFPIPLTIIPLTPLHSP